MSQTEDFFTDFHLALVLLWIGICLGLYLKKKYYIHEFHQEIPAIIIEAPTMDENVFQPPLSSTIVPEKDSTCNPGRMTINPWLNFLRHFRGSYCGIRRQNELFQKASDVWRNMTEEQKEPYRLQAEHMKSMRDTYIS